MTNKLKDEHVVLVDDNNKVIGTALKQQVHTQNTPLHRGFSLFLFNKKGEVLLQKRSRTKKTWPLIWSNSCCGHPRLREASVEAARRRLKFEVGVDTAIVFEVIPDYHYKAQMNGVTENELCPILVGFTSQEPVINKAEVEAVKWIPWKKFLKKADMHPKKYSAWCIEEAKLLVINRRFQGFYKRFVNKSD